jgi:hypothetical protein
VGFHQQSLKVGLSKLCCVLSCFGLLFTCVEVH